MSILGQSTLAGKTKVRTAAGGILSSGLHSAPRTEPTHPVNKKPLINILFQAVSETLLEFAQTHLKAILGITAVLHTWDQTLLDHFHLHCLVPAGALSFDQKRWSPARKNFLFPVTALSIVFRGKFLDLLKSAFATKQAPLGRSKRLPGQPRSLQAPD